MFSMFFGGVSITRSAPRQLVDACSIEQACFLALLARLPPALLAAFMERFSECEVCQSYGQTECAPVATSLEHADHLSSGLYGNKSQTVGRAVEHVTVEIVGTQGEVLPPNSIGRDPRPAETPTVHSGSLPPGALRGLLLDAHAPNIPCAT